MYYKDATNSAALSFVVRLWIASGHPSPGHADPSDSRRMFGWDYKNMKPSTSVKSGTLDLAM